MQLMEFKETKKHQNNIFCKTDHTRTTFKEHLLEKDNTYLLLSQINMTQVKLQKMENI